MKVDEPPVRVRVKLNSSVSKVWEALTDRSEMVKWYFENIPVFTPDVGFQTRFDVKSGERTFPHLWEVLVVKDEEELAYSWTYDGYKGSAVVSFHLKGSEHGTELIVQCNVLEDFQEDIPEFERSSCEAGWNYFMQRLKDYLEAN